MRLADSVLRSSVASFAPMSPPLNARWLADRSTSFPRSSARKVDHDFFSLASIQGAPTRIRHFTIGQCLLRLRLTSWLQNRTRGGRPYIAPDAEQEHYHCHMIVIAGVCGAGTSFESVAAVTELFLCASENGSQL